MQSADLVLLNVYFYLWWFLLNFVDRILLFEVFKKKWSHPNLNSHLRQPNSVLDFV